MDNNEWYVVISCYTWSEAHPIAAVYAGEEQALEAATRARQRADIAWVTCLPVPHETTV